MNTRIETDVDFTLFKQRSDLEDPLNTQKITEGTKNIKSGSHTLQTSHSTAAAQTVAKYSYYYCIKDKKKRFVTDFESDYVKRVTSKHPKKPCYPGKADIEHYELTPQYRQWEV